jgi:hypothetical protein
LEVKSSTDRKGSLKGVKCKTCFQTNSHKTSSPLTTIFFLPYIISTFGSTGRAITLAGPEYTSVNIERSLDGRGKVRKPIEGKGHLAMGKLCLMGDKDCRYSAI